MARAERGRSISSQNDAGGMRQCERGFSTAANNGPEPGYDSCADTTLTASIADEGETVEDFDSRRFEGDHPRMTRQHTSSGSHLGPQPRHTRRITPESDQTGPQPFERGHVERVNARWSATARGSGASITAAASV